MKGSARRAEEERAEAPVCRSCGTDLRATGRAAPRSFAGPLSTDSYLGRILLGETRWPTAPFLRRIVAAAIDAAIVAIVGMPGGFMVAHGWFSEPDRLLGLVAAGSALTLAALVYALTKDGWRGGAGIGKRLLGLRVVDVNLGAPCTLMRAALRGAAMVALTSVPYGGWVIEPVVAVIAAGGRRLGDHLAGTQVVVNAAQPSV